MNGKQLGILLAVLVLLGGLGLLIQNSHKQAADSGSKEAGALLLGDKFPVNDVAHIRIQQGTNSVNLVKKDDKWRVSERDDYPASFNLISDFLLKAKDMKVMEKDAVSPADLGALQLAPAGQGSNSATLLELMDKDNKAVKTLLLGKVHTRKPAQRQPGGDEGIPDGRYLMLSTDTNNVLLVGDPLSSIEAKPESWIEKSFFKIDRAKAVAESFPDATNSWKMTREGDGAPWKMADVETNENVDSNKLLTVANPFVSPNMDDVLPLATKPEEIGLDKPTVVTVDTLDDFHYVVKVGAKHGDDYPVSMSVTANLPKERTPAADEKAEDKEKADKAWKEQQTKLADSLKEQQSFEKRIYLVPAWNVDSILKHRGELMAEKKEEPAPVMPAGEPSSNAPTINPIAPAEPPK